MKLKGVHFRCISGAGEDAANPRIYLWTLCQEYFPEGQSLSRGSGISVPVALYLQKTDIVYVIASFKIPQDGTQYGSSIKAIFPQSTWDSIFGTDGEAYNQRAQMLEYESEGEAMVYYGLIKPGSVRPTYTPMR